MITNKYAWYSTGLTVILLSLFGVLFATGYFYTSFTYPAKPYQTNLFFIFLAFLALWALSGATGWIMLSRRGAFADMMEHLVGYEWACCIAGLFLLAGLWIVAVFPGPYLMWYASTRMPRPMCPKCKNWMPHGATKCAHCGNFLEAEPGQVPAQLVANISPRIGGFQCANCLAVEPPGAIYSFAYGTFAGSQYLGNRRTRYDFKIAGTQEVFLCDKCVSEFGTKRGKRIALSFSLGILGIMVALWVCSLLMNLISPESSPESDSLVPGIILSIVLIPVIYFAMQSNFRKNPLGQGDLLAIKLQKPALKAQGYTRFFTRQQIKDNQLL